MTNRHTISRWSAIAFASLIVGASFAADWKPDKNVEIIVWSAPGGGLDRPARSMQKILQDKRLVEATSTVVNKAGGGGTVGLAYMNQHAGDANYISLASTVLVTNRILGVAETSHLDTTPLALLAHDYMLIAVKADSPLKSGKELLARLVKDPASLSGGMTSRGGAAQITLGKALKANGGDPKKPKLVVFKSGGEATTALLGGHLDYAITVVPSVMGQVQSGQLRIIAIAAPQRLSGPLANVPTLKEQGTDVVVSNWRIVVGPKGMSAPQIAFWDGALGKMVQTDEWKKDLKDSEQEFVYLNSRDTAKYLDAQNKDLTEALIDLGLVKQ